MDKIIETKRLYLRKFTPDDIKWMLPILSDPVTMQFWPKPFDLEDSRRWIQKSIESYTHFGFGRYAVIQKDSELPIGDCGFLKIDINGKQENDLGYIISKEFWNLGYATEAAGACLSFGLESLKMKRIVANMESKHLASKAVAINIGLQFECEFENARNRNLLTSLFSI